VWTAAALAFFASAAPAETIQAIRVDSTGPLLDPRAFYWRHAKPVPVTMLAQTVQPPMHPDPGVKLISVKAAHNGQWFGLLLEWADPTKSDRIVVDQFGDQVAIELPLKYNPTALPNPMMGNVGGRVAVMQWRAAFQHDLESGDPTTLSLYPNALVDLYPDQVLRATDARPYQGALGVDNPISHARRSAVLDQMAEGWGTMTVKPVQNADGRGVWENGTWRVVITHPLWTGEDSDPDLRAGGTSAVAFAVWDGGNREVGSRKAWAPWVLLQMAP
jgi:DMSO reductase family type II enzyme heme b subunit